ncbi:diacylglycerol/lipid kinase family protein [Actinomadura rudentiformis]|uniref:YegS/Rv2252/BmrU family lipid kinase n=1 Tax=Actinomadura rudentiformis TaxID=359158 RepID=A0A6H9YKT2_9ACTN|nr:YegS/Rv2252/BmrU family lipid kinase [Actinomadura rudentiformis]KAB2345145.1 YegS/Rv2252/BmrU family lipid kinase [Actinomadura rudentiformis]
MRSKQELEAAIRTEGRAVLVVNARSRRGRRLFGSARRLLAEAGMEFEQVYPVTDPARLTEIFTGVLALEPDLVVVGGGDGTVAAAVSHLAHRDIALGVLPLGTTNNFSRSLELPQDLRRAVTVLREGKVADVDVGWFTGTHPETTGTGTDERHIFANMVSLGLSVEVARNVPHGLKRLAGRAAYGLTAVRLLPRHEAFKATVRIGDETQEFLTHQLNVANGAHHSGKRIARDASPDDRLLAVYRLGDERRIRLASATARHMLTGQWRSLDEDAFLTTDEVHIATEPPMAVDVDGEIRGQTPVTVKLLGNALRVIVPQSFIDI